MGNIAEESRSDDREGHVDGGQDGASQPGGDLDGLPELASPLLLELTPL